MHLTRDERRALSLVALLLVLSAAARLRGRPAEPAVVAGDALDLAAQEEAARRALEREERRSRPLAPGERLDPNEAAAGELDRLPGVGPALAARIVAERERGGPFGTAAELTRVSGIGERTAARLAPFLALPEGGGGGVGGGGGGAGAGFPPPAGAAPETGWTPVLTGGGGGAAGASSWSPDAAGGAGAAGRAAGGRAERLVDVNAATAAELERLPGIGPVLARRIVAYRDTAGPFRNAAELEAVPGIGPALRARLAPRLRFPP